MRPKRQNTHVDGLAETAGQKPAKCRRNKKSDLQRLKELITHTNSPQYHWRAAKFNAYKQEELKGRSVPLKLLCDILEYALTPAQVACECRKSNIPEWRISIIVRIYERKETL